ncbi:molybdopterin-guanine dinucleotide biosynthesis protein MobB [Desulfovibrio inopinatus]|uniref:molybdopterin-guanine dinucleotide biosynthesis protein MobB n=1 Tax=Desulfovibrio inopinatus TaxID=102109 RepID=UPI000414FE64|nr:molybdopterin-guanine dinucleotide biosynthesis protein MobB [Desulfovibrio inopinatus]
MIAVKIVGFKKSGKTTLTVDLVAELMRRNVQTAAAKSTHQLTLDKADTDTARLLEVATSVAALAPTQCGVAFPEKRSLLDLLPLLRGEALVVEGGKALGFLPQIVVLRDPSEAADLGAVPGGITLATFGSIAVPGIPHVETVADLADIVLAQGFLLPGLDCSACGFETCREMAARIVSGQCSRSDCKATSSELSISVGGAELGLNPFVASIVAGSIRGMLAQLKGYAGTDVHIHLKGGGKST